MNDLEVRLSALEAQVSQLKKEPQLNLLKEWLTVKETSLYTGFSMSSVHKWSHHPKYSNGKLRARKVGGKVLFKRSELDAYLNQYN